MYRQNQRLAQEDQPYSIYIKENICCVCVAGLNRPLYFYIEMECNYHVILETLNAAIWERIGTHYTWDFFDYWLGDDSNLGRLYREIIEEIKGEPLTEQQNTLLNKKGGKLRKNDWQMVW